MNSITLKNLVGKYVYIGFNEKIVIAGYEPPGPTKLIFVKLKGVDENGIFFEHQNFPMTNRTSGEVELVKADVFIPFGKISHISSFPDIDNFNNYASDEMPVSFTK